MKIIFIPNTSIQTDSNGSYLPRPDYDFLRNLEEKEYHFDVIGFESKKADPFSDYSLENISTLKLCKIGRFNKDKSAVSKLITYLKGASVSLYYLLKSNGFVYIYYPGHISMISAIFSIIMGKKYALYVRGIWVQKGVMGYLSNIIFSRAKFIFTTGRGFMIRIKNLNHNTEPVYPMTKLNPVNIPTFNRDYGRFKNALFVGHIKENKGVLDAVKSIALLKKENIFLNLHIIGGGDANDIRKIVNLANSLGIKDNIIYHGHVSDPKKLESYFYESDVFVYPSYYPEGFPRVIYESMSFALPMVCTVLPGMQGFISDQVNCLEVKKESPEDVAKALVRYNNDKKLRKDMGAKSREMVENYFSSIKIKSHADQFDDKLAGLI